MKTYTRLLTALFLAVFLLPFGTSAYAQDEEPAPAAEESTEALTQGQAAVQLAKRLGLFIGSDRSQTPINAIRLLMKEGIAPLAGWEQGAKLTPENLAVLLVRSLGKEDDVKGTDGDPTPQDFLDYLQSQYDTDINSMISDRDVKTVGKSDVKTDVSTGVVLGGNSDPLIDNTPLDITYVPISSEELETILVSVASAGTTGGSEGNLDEDSGNTTPSAPTAP